MPIPPGPTSIASGRIGTAGYDELTRAGIAGAEADDNGAGGSVAGVLAPSLHVQCFKKYKGGAYAPNDTPQGHFFFRLKSRPEGGGIYWGGGCYFFQIFEILRKSF